MSYRHISNCPQCGNPIYERTSGSEGSTAVDIIAPQVHRTCQCSYKAVTPPVEVTPSVVDSWPVRPHPMSRITTISAPTYKGIVIN